MILIEKSLGLALEHVLQLRTAEVFYSESHMLDLKGFDVVRFTQCTQQWRGKGRKFLTLLVALDQDKDALFNLFNSKTRYEIRRCEKSDDLRFEANSRPTDQEIILFISLYRRMQEEKNLTENESNCSFYLETLKQFRDNNALVLTSIETQDHQMLCMHTYLCDGKRARLINSASTFRAACSNFRALVGRGNRCLHWRDMLYFKEQGYQVYDLGGISGDRDNSVSKFKYSFGGTAAVEYYDFCKHLSLKGWLALWIDKICKLIQKIISQRC